MVVIPLFGDKATGNATRVPKTGQTSCWNESGVSISCAGTGQDGEYQLGVLPEIMPTGGLYGAYTVYGWTGIRFTNNLDGTVTDNLTGLIWLKNASCSTLAGTDANGRGSWTTVLSAANSLASGTCGLSDGSSPGDWRLPNINELHSLVDPTQTNPALPAGHPFTGVPSAPDAYWSSTTDTGNPFTAWQQWPYNGYVFVNWSKYNPFYVWPVRGGN